MGNVTLCAECSSSSKMKLRLHIFFHMVLKAKTKQDLLHFSQLSLHCLFNFFSSKKHLKKVSNCSLEIEAYLHKTLKEQLKCKPESNQDEIHLYLNHECICFHSSKNIWNLLNGFSQTSKSRTKRDCHAFFPNIIPNTTNTTS